MVDERILNATRQWTLVQPIVSAYVGAIVRDFAARDDLLQEIAVAVLETYDRYDSSRSFQAWTLGIARNQIRNFLRQRSRDRLTFDEQTIANLADAFAESQPAQVVEHLQSCLDKLDSKARQILEMRYERDLKPADIAAQTNATANTVSKALQRIRDLLRDCVRRQASLEGAR